MAIAKTDEFLRCIEQVGQGAAREAGTPFHDATQGAAGEPLTPQSTRIHVVPSIDSEPADAADVDGRSADRTYRRAITRMLVTVIGPTNVGEPARIGEIRRKSSGEHALARPLRGGPAGGAAGVHRQPALRPAARADDIAGCPRHVRGLGRGGLLSADEVEAVLACPRHGRGGARATERSSSCRRDEDIHTAVERRVTELAGDAGRQAPHRPEPQRPGRHRPAALVQATSSPRSRRRVLALQEALVARADEAGDAYLPGYTHLQRAQPVLLASPPARPRLGARPATSTASSTAAAGSTCRRSGAGALAGSSLPLDPDGVAADLGFAGRFDNSLDAVGDRDFVAEALFVLALCRRPPLPDRRGDRPLVDRRSSASSRLDDAYSTGSSMLPQKKNPDIAELARGKAGRLIGHLTGFLATLKGLPLAYNRDLQEDKEPLFDAVDAVRLGLGALAGHACAPRRSTPTGWRPRPTTRRARPSTWPSWLVDRGMPFRSAHAVVGALVRESLDRGVPLAELVEAHPDLGTEAVVAARARHLGEAAHHPGRRRPGAAWPSSSRVDRPPDRDLTERRVERVSRRAAAAPGRFY